MPDTQIEVLLEPGDLREALEHDARTGLTAAQKWLPPKYFYDARGSEIFEEITRLPEYYPTRTEAALLRAHATDIGHAAGADTLLELGSGSSEKTRLLLDALAGDGALTAYVPVDVSASALEEAVAALGADYPGLRVHGAVADFDRHLADLPEPGHRLVALLGGTIGNHDRAGRHQFLTDLASGMKPGEALLLGLDLVKDPARLVAAYDDAAGVTADFNRNALRVLNRELAADFDVAAFTHVAVWNEVDERIEMRLRAQREMTVHLSALDLTVGFERGEELLTEYSCKFRRDGVHEELAEAGFVLEQWWTDPDEDFALVLARR
ncbi:L-histidine N(alpha)-methyltransferase [Nocardioides panacisoli]|uniref:L-histidine N(alpha)-methyltransferase n=1 Tax=Nocardioides panacisoli TaxID=627624 RepID=UPI001C638318|nr:L-histidine N(alpha)-methyltransferase [Nocardioides panacisoli]QYJ05697.1 L-histidine N(alpha)-methyltransferase [Nocardioides panacisoli]